MGERDGLERVLRHGAPELRRFALERMARLGVMPDAALLRDLSRDEDVEVRDLACSLLRAAGEGQPPPPPPAQRQETPARVSSGPRFRVNDVVAAALKVLRPCIDGLLALAAGGGDEALARQAVSVLGRLRDWSTVGPLVELLRQPSLAADAALALAAIGDLRAVRPLVQTVEQRSGVDRGALVMALGGFHTRDTMLQLVAFLHDPSPDLRAQAALTLRSFADGPEARAALLEALGDDERRVVVNVLLALKGTDDEDVGETLVEFYGATADDHVKATILSALQGTTRFVADAADLVARASRDGDSRVRANAVELLRSLDVNAESRRELLVRFDGDDDNRVLGNLATAWGVLDPARSLAILQRMLASPDKWTRASAVHVGRHVVDDRVSDWLLAVLADDEDEDVLRNALGSLAEHPGPRVVAGLLPLLEHRLPLVRSGVARVLGTREDPRVAGELVRRFARETDEDVRAELIVALGELRAVEFAGFLTEQLKTGELPVQVAAVEALDRLARLETVPSLVPFLRAQDGRLRASAAVALWHQGVLTVAESLASMLRHPELRWRASAMTALATLGGELPTLAASGSRLHLCSALMGQRDVAPESPVTVPAPAPVSAPAPAVAPAPESSDPLPIDDAEEAAPLQGVLAVVDHLVRGEAAEAADLARRLSAEGAGAGEVPWKYLAGLAEARAGRHQEAAALWEEGADEVPGFHPAAVDAAGARQAAGDARSALDLYVRAFRAKLDLMETALANLEVLLGQERLVEASSVIRDLLAVESLDRAHHGRLGVAFLRAGRHAEARNLLLQALVTEPDSRSMQYNLALACYHLGRREECRILCERVVGASAPGAPEAGRARQLAALVTEP